ncbi:MAG TPA: DUF6496 domain-containing protein [Cytophagaceae bacterium]|jgi:hypothetical protein|nr:DUF6496 domain-containing protein [Cytophagaceae bacterium]
MAKYDKKSQEKVKRAMHEMKTGKLKSGPSGESVKNKKQAVAIGLSEARKAGSKVPEKPTSARSKNQRGPTRKKKSSAQRKTVKG